MANYDVIGNIAIFKFPNEAFESDKKPAAEKFLKEHPQVKTVLEKVDKVKGRLRTIKTKHLLGEKNLIADYKESGCRFKLKVDSCYFSPRLANERLEVAKLIKKHKKNAHVLVMFAGVAPFSIVIAKYSKPSIVYSAELGKECCKYAEKNLLLNKIYSGVRILQGDVKRILGKGKKIDQKFDVVVMPRPNLKDSFLKEALSVAKKGTLIIYYGFSAESEKDKMISELLKEAGKLKRKLRVLNVKEAGDIAPYEHRYRVEMKVL